MWQGMLCLTLVILHKSHCISIIYISGIGGFYLAFLASLLIALTISISSAPKQRLRRPSKGSKNWGYLANKVWKRQMSKRSHFVLHPAFLGDLGVIGTSWCFTFHSEPNSHRRFKKYNAKISGIHFHFLIVLFTASNELIVQLFLYLISKLWRFLTLALIIWQLAVVLISVLHKAGLKSQSREDVHLPEPLLSFLLQNINYHLNKHVPSKGFMGGLMSS